MKATGILIALSAVLSAALAPGCVPVLAGGAVAETTSVVTERRTVGSQVSDSMIESRVALRINEKIDSDDRHITVTSFNGKVLLTGEVRTESARSEAESIASSDIEAKSVVNELAVQELVGVGQRLSDSTLATKVRSRVIGTKGTYLNQMKVVVDRGIVYLMGMVTTDEGATAAETAATTSGVASVVKVFEYLSAEEIESRMKTLSGSTESTGSGE